MQGVGRDGDKDRWPGDRMRRRVFSSAKSDDEIHEDRLQPGIHSTRIPRVAHSSNRRQQGLNEITARQHSCSEWRACSTFSLGLTNASGIWFPSELGRRTTDVSGDACKTMCRTPLLRFVGIWCTTCCYNKLYDRSTTKRGPTASPRQVLEQTTSPTTSWTTCRTQWRRSLWDRGTRPPNIWTGGIITNVPPPQYF